MKIEKTRILAHIDTLRAAQPGPFWATLAIAGVTLFSMVAAFGTSPSTVQLQVPQRTVIEQLAPPISVATESFGDVFVREERVLRGDSVATVLARLGVQDDAAFQFLRAEPRAQVIFRDLRPGRSITAYVGDGGELRKLIYPLNGMDRVLLIERRDGHLYINESVIDLERQVEVKSGVINYSLFSATDTAGIPDSVARELTDIFSSEIDFHRDLRNGDRFAVVYETFTHLGQPVRSGRILAAEFVCQGKTYSVAWFKDGDAKGDYYTPDGKSVHKTFLRSPLEFSRITSGFSPSRFHPILQQWRAHKGVDYGAPIGTRVKATADGVVEFVGNQGGYGRVVVLRHQGLYTTLYGHLSAFAANLRKGTRIAQGDVLGYVGASGWATGPHLHYEFRIGGVYQNPLAVALLGAAPLSPQQLQRFRAQVEPDLARLNLIESSSVASLD